MICAAKRWRQRSCRARTRRAGVCRRAGQRANDSAAAPSTRTRAHPSLFSAARTGRAGAGHAHQGCAGSGSAHESGSARVYLKQVITRLFRHSQARRRRGRLTSAKTARSRRARDEILSGYQTATLSSIGLMRLSAGIPRFLRRRQIIFCDSGRLRFSTS